MELAFSVVQPDQMNMAVFFWHLVKSDLSSVHSCTCVHWTSHFLQGIRNTRPYLTGHPVDSALPNDLPDERSLHVVDLAGDPVVGDIHQLVDQGQL